MVWPKTASEELGVQARCAYRGGTWPNTIANRACVLDRTWQCITRTLPREKLPGSSVVLLRSGKGNLKPPWGAASQVVVMLIELTISDGIYFPYNGS
jgi:hypothetical protein